MAKLSIRTGVLAGLAAGLAALTGTALAVVAGQPASADTPPPSIVEDYSYPGAAKILAEQNVKLISGDGHILLADCATAPVGNVGLLKVFTEDETIGSGGLGRVCFKITGTTGYLALQVPAVYEIRGDGQQSGYGHHVTASVRSDDGDSADVAVNPSGSTQVGHGIGDGVSPTTLLQLKVTG
jgi:hypothetical protein